MAELVCMFRADCQLARSLGWLVCGWSLQPK